MVAQLPFGFVCSDMLFAAGLGFGLALCYQIARMALGAGKIACFVCDLGIFVLGGLLYYSMAVGRFYARMPRWYTMAALLAAYTAYFFSVAPLLDGLAAGIKQILCVPFAMCKRFLFAPAASKLQSVWAAKRAQRVKQQQKRKQSRKKVLPKDTRVLYNSK